MRRPSPLVRRAPVRLLGSGVGGVLVAAAFTLFAVAAAASPLFTESAGNAALRAELRTVPGTASADASPVVRVVGSQAQPGGGATRILARIPGLGPAVRTAASIGAELHPLGSAATDVSGPDGSARARLFGQPRAASALVPSGAAATGPGLWLPAPVAREIGAVPGDAIRVGLGEGKARAETPARVAGLYAVGANGRTPADRPGTHLWSERRAVLPADSQFSSEPAYLIVGDIDTVIAVAQAVNDDLLFAVEKRLDPAMPTLRRAEATAGAVERQVARIHDAPITDKSHGPVRDQVISGLPTIVGDASRIADRSTAWTATIGAAGVVMGLVTVLAAARLSVRRRTVEMQHAVGAGLRPAAVGTLAAAETLAVAVVCSGLGLLGAWGVVASVGPGWVTTASLGGAATRAALAGAAGVFVTAVVTALAAARAARLTSGGHPSVAVPWEVALVAVAATAAGGLWSRPAGGPAGALDLLVPVLVLAALGAVGGRLLPRLAGRLSPTRPVPALVVRRLAAGGAAAALVVTALAAGFGMLGYSLAAASSVREVTADRVAVHAGAQATAGVDASWLLDDGAPRLAAPDPDLPAVPHTAAVPGARVPPLPRTETVVWRGRTTVPPDYDNIDLLVVDPARFARVAAWGGGRLRDTRELMSRLAAGDRTTARALRVGDRSHAAPAIGVGDVVQRPGDRAAINVGKQGMPDVTVRLLDVVPAFPGFRGDLPMIVVPADSFFLSLGELDPRVVPPSGRVEDAASMFRPELWSARGEAGLQAVLAPRGLVPHNTQTLARLAHQPDVVGARSAIGFQVALGACLAVIGVIVLALFADRVASRARPADLLLARMGLGANGALRARAAELAALVCLAAALAAAGVVLLTPLGPRLLDPGGGGAPPFALRPDTYAVAVTLVAAGLGLAVAVGAARARAGGGSAEEVLRDAD